MIIVTKWFGVFLCDKEKVRKSILFDKDSKHIAAKLAIIQHGQIIPEEEEISKGLKRLRVADARLSKIGKPEVFDASFIKAEDFGYSQELMQTVMVELGKLRTREPLAPDKGILQAIRAIDDVTEQINALSERLHEWYGLHFPELNDYAKDEKYAELIANHGGREEVLKALELRLESVGAELMDEDVSVIQEFATAVFSLYETKERLDVYVQKRMEAYAPNLTTLVSANLGARLISLAGGLGRLTKLPSSTVQLLGAEKAMFMHLRSGKSAAQARHHIPVPGDPPRSLLAEGKGRPDLGREGAPSPQGRLLQGGVHRRQAERGYGHEGRGDQEEVSRAAEKATAEGASQKASFQGSIQEMKVP